MPMTLNVGLSRKKGEPNYGSRGASVNLELELDSALVADPDRLRDRIRQLFHLAKDAVDEELTANGATHPNDVVPGNGNGHGNGNGMEPYRMPGNGHRNQRTTNGPRRATSSQVKAIHAIGSRSRIDVTRLVQDRFGVQRPDELSIGDASSLIDELKATQNGEAR